MAHQPPWNPQYGPPRTDQGTDFEPGLFERTSHDPNVPPGPRPTPAHGNVSATGYGEPVSHGYWTGTVESAPFTAFSAFGPPHTAGFSMQPNPTLDNTWNPPPPPTQFHGYGLSTWTPPTDWQVSSMSSLSASHSLVAPQAAALAPGPPVLGSSTGFGPAFNPIATSPARAFGMVGNTAPAAPHQPHLQPSSRSTPGPGAFFRRKLQRLKSFAFQDIESCWKCKSDHKKCGPGTPCWRCAAVPSSGNSPIPCRRGQVCDAAAEIRFLCHIPRGASRLLVEGLPLDHQPAARLLSQARRRRSQTARQIKGGESVAGNKYAVFCRVVSTNVENIRSFNWFPEDLSLITPVELPYDDLIASIVWELEDNPEAAQLVGVESVEGLVALLEAACLCETQWGHHDRKKRLIYSSIHCLLHCMEALRLSAHGLLTADPHAGCDGANECISPAFHGLTRNALRYAETLTTALFHKQRSKQEGWLLVFYSLCLQGHVRRALMSLEERLEPAELFSGGMEVEGFARPLRSANYLQTAVSLFDQISRQNRGKLARQIRNAQPKPSVYLQQSPPLSRPGDGSSNVTWQMWREEGITEFLGRIFHIPVNDSTTPHHQPHYTKPPDTGTDSDSDATITPAPPPPPPTLVAATAAVEMMPMATAMAATAHAVSSVSSAGSDCWTISPPENTSGTSIIDSLWSVTSYGESSDASTFYAGSLSPSLRSLSTVTLDDDTVENDFWI